MRSFWKFFITNNSFTALLAMALAVAGILALVSIPKESAPEVQIPMGIITTVLPGASAEDMERLVTNKIEDRVLGVENVSKVTSTSGDGVSSITVEFNAQADIDKSIQLLKDEVAKVEPELPTEAEDPTVSDINFADQPILLISLSGDLAPAELTALGTSVQDELERVTGVSSVSVSGVQAREVQVIVQQAKLAQYGLSLSDVTNAIQASGLASPAGSITVDGVQYGVRLEAGITDTDQVANIAFVGPGNVPLFVRDVANVVDGLEDPATYSRVSVDGAPSAPALTLSVFKSRGGNIVETGNDVKDRLLELQETTLAGTEIVISYDAADDVAHDLIELTRVGLETMALVTIVLLVTIGWREAVVAAVSVPMSFLIAFIGLNWAGTTLNFVSLFSLILAIGILVDSGIVVVEAFHTRLKTLKDKRVAAFAAIEEYAWPLIAGTFTTVAVFIPLFFLSGIMGEFIKSIPFTVIFVLLASIFVALGLVPLAAIYFVKEGEASELERKQEEYNDKAKAWYEGFLRSYLGNKKKENRFIAIMAGLFFVALLLPVVGAVKVVFFPEEEMEFFYVEAQTAYGTSLTDTDLAMREIEEYLYADEDIASFVADVGSGSAFGSGGSGSNVGSITVNLHEDRDKTTQEIMAEVREYLAPVTSADITVSAPAGGPPTGAAFQATFFGDDRIALAESLETAERVLSDVPGVGEITTSLRDDNAEFVVRIDSARAAALGVSPAAVAGTLRSALYGAKAADIRTETDDIEVRTKLDLNPTYQDPSETNDVTVEALRTLTVQGASGPVPLSSVAEISYEAANAAIRHEDGTRIATIEATLAPGGNAIQVASAFEEAMQAETLPDSIDMRIGGETEEINRAFTEMLLALVAGAALMLAILVLEFNSFRQSAYLLSLIPLSLAGVFFGLMLTGQPLSFPAMLGIIALAGVIINHAIILMDSIARIGRSHPTQSLTDTVVEAASTRFRPIVLTTITTVVGMIPLSMASGMWGPLAFTIMFGLAYSLLLTLLLVPILYNRWPGKKALAAIEEARRKAAQSPA